MAGMVSNVLMRSILVVCELNVTVYGLKIMLIQQQYPLYTP